MWSPATRRPSISSSKAPSAPPARAPTASTSLPRPRRRSTDAPRSSAASRRSEEPPRPRSTPPNTMRLGFRAMLDERIWSVGDAETLREELGDVYAGRTVLVTGADGFMGSHLTDALVELGANVHAFVRATSSGALNNIGHLWPSVKVHFADLTDRTSVDYLVKELLDAPDRPYVFHLGAAAHVGEPR